MSTGLSRPAVGIQGDSDQASDEAASQGASSTAQEVNKDARPYPPSWVDQLTNRVRRLPLPAWVFYLAAGFGLMLLLLSIAWTGGELPPGTFEVDYFLAPITFAYLLALIHYLDDWAGGALSRFRPVMTVDDAGYEKLCFQLTTLPPLPTLIASGLGAVYGLGTLAVDFLLDANQVNRDVEAISLVLPIVQISFRTLFYIVIAVLVYHTIHQLRMVNRIYTNHTRINLFQRGPMYALSGLTARTAIGIGIPTYVWFQYTSSSSSGNSPADIFETAFMGIVIIATFIWPLWGAHNLLEGEKQRLKDEVARRLEATITTLNSRVDADKHEDAGALKDVLDGLLTEQGESTSFAPGRGARRRWAASAWPSYSR